MDRTKSNLGFKTELVANNTRRKLFVRRELHGARSSKSHCDRENHKNPIRNRYDKYLYAVISACSIFISPLNAVAETVGGVSATANPVANSSGSVTNQAIQVLQGPYITNQYGDGIACQGPTLNLTPYVTRSYSWQFPYESHYDDPVYNMLDLSGDTDADGNVIPDGIPDNPGEILYHRQIRTGQKDNYNWNAGFSATLSWPLDGKAQRLCKEAVQHHNALRSQMVANRRLEFELTRLSKCGKLSQEGIVFHPKSPYYRICADVVVRPPVVQSAPHRHSIPVPSRSEQPYSESAADLGAPVQTPSGGSYPVRSQSSSAPSSPLVSPTLTKGQQQVLQEVQKSLPQQQ